MRRGGGGGRSSSPAGKPPCNHCFSASLHFSNSIRKWALFHSLRYSSFPSGADPHFESDQAFPAVFSHLATRHPPITMDHVVVEAEKLQFLQESLNFEWPARVASPFILEETCQRIFQQVPSWFSPPFPAETEAPNDTWKRDARDIGKKQYDALRRRQIKAETEAWVDAVNEYKGLEREMLEKKLAPNLPYCKSLLLGWFEPLRDAIAKEQRLQRTKQYKNSYSAHIGLLPADRMAVIVMHKMMTLLMNGQGDGYVTLVQAAIHIGGAIEHEAKLHHFLDKTKGRHTKVNGEDGAFVGEEHVTLRRRIEQLVKNKKFTAVRKLLKAADSSEPWSRPIQAQLGSRLIELLMESAFVQAPNDPLADAPPDVRPAFNHVFRTISKRGRVGKKYGVIECDKLVHEGLSSSLKHMLIPYIPMLIPPKKWKGYEQGGYLYLPSYLMRTHGSKQQQDAIGSVPRKQLQKVFQALDTLGSTRWRVNKRILGIVETIWSQGGRLAGLVDREDILIPERPNSDDINEIRQWKWDCRKAKKINNERHAMRCDIELKLRVAQKMRDEVGFYYPHNLDFRGRAYPMHPHLNHLSSDLCRGVLEFAEGRPLGKSGLNWLKIQLANLYAGGVEKLSLDGRLAFVENNLDAIFDSANRPIDGERWWLNAEDPFQCLAACINLSEALRSPSPSSTISHLPIHQDGSCNGLQHYAALGRDSMEAASVNLIAAGEPADVYSGIAARVLDYIRRDSERDPATYPNAMFAKLLVNQVDRKLVKQTVMTSVYGVTFIGARDQIKKRLEERHLITDEEILFGASCYAAKVTMTALGEMFQAARAIMQWLAECAKVITSVDKPVKWTTPIGLPVVQPYMKFKRKQIKTSLQTLSLKHESSSVEVKRQKTAFPPNFIHSLDGSHMMMTAIACNDAGLNFAGVHDSFWTHACDVDKMNQILREQFVELYNIPILENLLESFETSYPGLRFPPLPERGNFDLNEVLRSPYFFN